MRVEAAIKQSFSSSFELSGSSQQGELKLFTPIGSTAASIQWSAQTAQLQTTGEPRQFPNLSSLLTETLGADLPLAALFDWLEGRPTPIDGWLLDLSEIKGGKMSAQRTSPTPAVVVRVILE